METPEKQKNNSRARTSSRKKSLFSEKNKCENKKSNNLNPGLSDDDLDGIEAFDPVLDQHLKKAVKPLRKSTRQHQESPSGFSNGKLSSTESKQLTPPTRVSSRLQKLSGKPTVNSSTPQSVEENDSMGDLIKKDFPNTVKLQSNTVKMQSNSDDLLQLFNDSLNIRNNKNRNDSSEEELIIEETPIKLVAKRAFESIDEESPRRKVYKLNDLTQISTKSFYSKKTEKTIISTPLPVNYYSPIRTHRSNRKKKPRRNKSVMHKIKKDPREKKRAATMSIDDILKSIKSEKLKHLPSKRLSSEKIALVHNILKSSQNPIELARPLKINPQMEVSCRFSDLESSDDDDNDIGTTELHSKVNNNDEAKENFNNLNEKSVQQSPTKKKFFKSGDTLTRKQVNITDSIKADFSKDRKLILVKDKKKRKIKTRTADLFSMEQSNVDNIIEHLDMEVSYTKESASNNNSTTLNHEFYSRIPYQTIDPEKIKEQHILMDFLISNNICTEENFKIFIVDPGNNEEEIDRIFKKVVDDEFIDFRKRIPYNTSDPEKIEQQMLLMDFLIDNDICTERNFQIFISDPENHTEEAEKIVDSLILVTNNKFPIENIDIQKESTDQINEVALQNPIFQSESSEIILSPVINEINKTNLEAQNSVNNPNFFPIFYANKSCQPILKKSSRNRQFSGLSKAATGSNQYQIDFGQKNYGAKQCKQCGLIYSCHEPEEEKIHSEYHQSLHVLKFRGWIDEDVVSTYPEWGFDGRIIRLTNFAHQKKKERLLQILEEVVDKELGFSSYILPEEYVVFLAIRQQKLVGLCLVQFLECANRYICIDGIDCCTEEKFKAKCGISRIWVSPFHRRIHVATKLIGAVQTNTIIGEHIDLDLIAFSSPTEYGKIFAQKITKKTDFLVYQ